MEVIKIIFDKYINTTMGVAAIAAFLNESGYVKRNARIIRLMALRHPCQRCN